MKVDRPPHRQRLAHALSDLSDVHFSGAAKIVLVQDNLTTHKPASLYGPFPRPQARRLVERFEWHYTPKHGSWLDWRNPNSAFSRRNVWIAASPTRKLLANEVAAWQDHRNKHHAKANWQFTTADARVKLKSLYPQFE